MPHVKCVELVKRLVEEIEELEEEVEEERLTYRDALLLLKEDIERMAGA